MELNLEKVNTGRQLEFDIAKVLAIFFMVIIHVADNMSTVTNDTTIFSVFLDFLGGPLAAPVFMFAMGVGIVYSRHHSAKDSAKRGLSLLLMGYVLNFFRETILLLIAHANSISTTYDKSIIDTIGTVDILQFAGMSFLLIALFRKLRIKPVYIFLIALVMQGVGSLLIGQFDAFQKALQYILGLCFFTNQYISFPLFQWFVYPAAGMLFATILQCISDKDKFYKKVTIFSGVILLATSICSYISGLNILNYFTGTTYYAQNFFSFMWVLPISLIFISFCYVLSKHLSEVVMNWFKKTAAQVNTIYIIQWLVITYLIAFKELAGIGYASGALVIPLGIVIAIISIILSGLYQKIKKKVGKQHD